MNLQISPELWWLTATCIMTGLFWVPYLLQQIVEMGVIEAFWDPYHETQIKARWAQRAKRAHSNAVENLAVFAPLALGVHVMGAGTALTGAACAAYFGVRAVHYCVYAFGIPLMRPFLFLAGIGCQAVLALTLFGLFK